MFWAKACSARSRLDKTIAVTINFLLNARIAIQFSLADTPVRNPRRLADSAINVDASLLLLWPLLKHLLHGFFHILLILVAVIAQRVLRDPAPHQLPALGVVQAHNHGGFVILFWSNSAHTAANAPHAPDI